MKKKCIICEKEFNTFPSAGKGANTIKSKRKSNAMTCSKSCSKVYIRIMTFISSRNGKVLK